MLDIFDKVSILETPKNQSFDDLHEKLLQGNGTWADKQRYRNEYYAMSHRERAIFISRKSEFAAYLVQQFGGIDNVEVTGCF